MKIILLYVYISMVTYECDKCGKIFAHKNKYTIHVEKKFDCNRDINNHNLKCTCCDATFKNDKCLKKHLRSKNHKNTIMLQEIVDEIKELKSKIDNKPVIQNNTQINSNNNNINIQLVAFGYENLDESISDVICKKILNKGFNSVQTLVEYVHFNEKFPQYHNCYISNRRDNCAVIYDGNSWNLKNSKIIIDDLCMQKLSFLEEKYEELKDDLDIPTKKKFNKFLEEKDADCRQKIIKDDLKVILYNNKEIAINIRNNNMIH